MVIDDGRALVMEALVDVVDVVSDRAGTTVMLAQSFTPNGERASVTVF